ncbi:MAG TPA: hypothetical protein VHO25_18975, partial [Polyangiaceae bacterium]|nr:hypothetical protein [Polyangiaceae bacterium]
MKQTNRTVLLGLLIALSACAQSRTAQDPGQSETAEASPGHDPASQRHEHTAMGPGKGKHSGMHQHDGHKSMAMMEGRCPMHVEGATVSAVDTETGIALVFTTSGDVSELRARVAQMAEHQQKMMSQGHMGMMHSGKHSGDHGKEPGAKSEAAAHDHTNSAADQPNSGCTCCAHAEGMHGKRVEHTAQVVEVEGGAKIVYTPKQPADLAALR